MRCYCCDRNLNDYESTRKSLISGEYLDTCSRCLEDLNIDTEDREDLNPFDEVQDDYEWDDREIEDDN